MLNWLLIGIGDYRGTPDAAAPPALVMGFGNVRERAIEHMRIALEGGDVKVPADLKPQLPYLLWLYQMGLILFWLYDRSENQQRTQKLTEKSLGLLVTLLRLSGLPLMKPVRKTALEMVETFAP